MPKDLDLGVSSKLPTMGDYYTSRLMKILNVMRDVYDQSIGSDAARADPPAGAITVQLHGHQQAMIHRMAEQEVEFLTGKDCSGAKVYADYGVLADSVGSGKSLMILGHIARLDTLPLFRRIKGCRAEARAICSAWLKPNIRTYQRPDLLLSCPTPFFVNGPSIFELRQRCRLSISIK
jgi:hypothetical protein